MYLVDNRRNSLAALFLCCMLLVSAGFITYLYAEWSQAASACTQFYSQVQTLNMTLHEISVSAPKVAVAVQLIPVPSTKTILPNTVTFVTGYLTVTNLTEIYTPALLIASFNVSHSTLNPHLQVEYSWIQQQSVYLLKGIEKVDVPTGIFPISVYNATKGDVITLFMTAEVQIVWQPVSAVMARQTATAQFTLVVEGT